MGNLIRPFAGVRPLSKYVTKMIAPPYDVVTRSEASALAKGNPYSFLHISKPDIDLDESIDSYDSSVYQKAKENFSAMFSQGILKQDEKPCYYIYRMQHDKQQQTGIVAAVSLDAYRENRVLKHENTRIKKEMDRVNLMKAINAQPSPLLLCYRHNQIINELIQQAVKEAPIFENIILDNVQHSLWIVSDDNLIQRITDAFDAMPNLYVADGHHRSAAALRIGDEHKTNVAYQYFLAALFPDNELQILGYHRVIADLNGMSQEEFLKQLEKDYKIEVSQEPVVPARPKEFGMYLKDHWYRLQWNGGHEYLDVNLLHDTIIAPLLGIVDLKTDKRIDFIGGGKGIQTLQRCVDSGEMALAFSLYPTSIEQLLTVSDNHQIMSPKSTWFEPKLADGLILMGSSLDF